MQIQKSKSSSERAKRPAQDGPKVKKGERRSVICDRPYPVTRRILKQARVFRQIVRLNLDLQAPRRHTPMQRPQTIWDRVFVLQPPQLNLQKGDCRSSCTLGHRTKRCHSLQLHDIHCRCSCTHIINKDFISDPSFRLLKSLLLLFIPTMLMPGRL